MKILKCIKKQNDLCLDLTVGHFYEISKYKEDGLFIIFDDYWKFKFGSFEEFLKSGKRCIIDDITISENFKVVE